ncbi:MAG: UDP-2,3-diacylglucosamine diphosphatase [Flavobacteriales bacterium]|nr:UDP-2,3-diacylglucosamine diphosphatase [Flavobacteriales bacterium]
MEQSDTPKKIYFASDFHLGIPSHTESLIREKKIVAWLEDIRKDAEAIYLMGDLFDFWFEYKYVIPKGFTRLLGKIAELTDAGIEINFFIGNHDMWCFDYFKYELGLNIFRNPISIDLNGKRFYLAHGDGLGPKDYKYKFLKKIFRNPLCQWLFAIIPPSIGIGLAQAWSGSSRATNPTTLKDFLGEDKEWLIQHSKAVLKKEHFDYFIYGHRHIPFELDLKENSKYINLGDWISHLTYAEFDGKDVTLKSY